MQRIDAVSLDVDAGEAVAILGPNGAGKTTLLRTLAGLQRPAGGAVTFEGRDVTGRPAEQLVRAGIALVPEGRTAFAELSVRDNLLLGAYRRRGRRELDDLHALFPILAERARQRARHIVRRRAADARHRPRTDGEAGSAHARRAVARPRAARGAPVIDRLAELRDRGTKILLVEQNVRAALRVATRGYVLRGGAVVLEAPADHLADAEIAVAYLGT